MAHKDKQTRKAYLAEYREKTRAEKAERQRVARIEIREQKCAFAEQQRASELAKRRRHFHCLDRIEQLKRDIAELCTKPFSWQETSR